MVHCRFIPSVLGTVRAICYCTAAILSWLSPAWAVDYYIAVPPVDSVARLDAALDEARAHRKKYPAETIIIDLPPLQFRTFPLRLGPEDSGNDGAPLIFRGPPNGGATFTGGLTLPSEAVTDTTADPVSRIPLAFQTKVRRARMQGAGLLTKPEFSEHGSFKPGPGRLFVFEGNRRLEPARWPSRGYAILSTASGHDDQGNVTLRLPNNLNGLERESDLWIGGYWGWNWWFETRKITGAVGATISFRAPESPIKPGARYFLFNIAQGIDRDGVFYFDAPTNSLYFVAGDGNASGELTVPIVDSLVQIRGAANIRFENVAFEKTIGPAATVENSRNIVFKSCFVGHTGQDGIVINAGTGDRIESCVLDDIGYSAVNMFGGDTKMLISGGHVVRDSKISHFSRELPTYQPGVRLNGVGLTVEGSEISDAPHAGIIFSGNDHKIVGNILHDLVLDTSDAGAIYAGRSWTARGTAIESNYIYNVKNRIDSSGVMGVYLDDQLSGTAVDGNVFRDVDLPVLIGGGRDNRISKNLFIASKSNPITLDSRGLNWQSAMAAPGGLLREGLAKVPYRQAPYDRYPSLATILEDQPGAPLNNRFTDNLGDVKSIVSYDFPKTATFGVDSGNLAVGKLATDFPIFLNGLPPDAPAFAALTETVKLIQKTMSTMKNLPFRNKIADR